MDFGKKINELRKTKNVTQEELAAELGVTAAAVSKWENGYTLPDILMLCALADYFGVTTDELLGRAVEKKFAVIAAETEELGLKIAQMAKDRGLIVHGIYDRFDDAIAAARDHGEIQYLPAGFYGPYAGREWNVEVGRPIDAHISIGKTDQDILDGLFD